MRTALMLLAPLAAMARPVKEVESYANWLVEFGGRFAGDEATFQSNVARIRAHNANPSNTWRMGVNQFAAINGSEFKRYYAGYKRGARPQGRRAAALVPADASLSTLSTSALPASLDWRTQGVVTPVKDQGGCGGCWAFSAAETLESHIAIKTGKLMKLSEQQILDCTPNPNDCGGTGGCSGATQELAFQYVYSVGTGNIAPGITTEAEYPFTGGSSFPSCDTSRIKAVANITGYVELPVNNYTALMNAVVSIGPIAISAAAEPWQLYDGGVFSSACGTDVDHAIVLEGYGHDAASGLDYYLVRNSWSAAWGENGYIRVARYGATPNGEPCAEDKTPGDGDGCNGGPAQIEVCGLCGILSDSSYPTGGHLV